MLLRTSRRRWLTGLGCASAAAPFLRPFFAREAAADAGIDGPMRLVVVQTPDGRPPSTWTPQGTTHNFSLGSGLAPFEPLKDDLVVMSGVDILPGGGSEPHCASFVTWMTGENSLPTVDNYTPAALPSFDQIVAAERAITGDTAFASLQLAGDMTTFDFDISHRYMSWAGPDQPLPGEHRSSAIYQHLFSSFVPPDNKAALARLVNRRGSVLDLVADDWSRLSAVTPNAQRVNLDAHLEAIRALENRLDDIADGGGLDRSCEPPDGAAIPQDPSFPEQYALNLELLRLALACDLCRVVTFLSSPSTSNVVHDPWIEGLQSNTIHHQLSHAGAEADLSLIGAWYAQQIATFVQGLKDTPDGTGSLLDHTVVLYGSELAYSHATANVPLVLFGNACGQVETGRYLDFQGDPRSTNDVWVSIAQLLGLPWESFGDPAKNNGAIPNLV